MPSTPYRRTPLLLVLLLLSCTGCLEDDPWHEELSYEVVRERVFDEPPRTQVDQWIAVSGHTTERNLRSLLQARYDSVITETSYEANDRPTNVYIYLFPSKSAAEKGGAGWLAMLEKRPDSEVSIRVRETSGN